MTDHQQAQRSTSLALGLLMLLGPALAPAAPPGAGCESTAPRPERLHVSCTLAETAQRLTFRARLSGSHDDTTASLTSALDGRPLACDSGSKTSLEGNEEGDVELVCRFAVAAQHGTAPRRLSVSLKWHHAQYTGFELLGE